MTHTKPRNVVSYERARSCYLIKHVLICIHFQNINLNIGQSQFQKSCLILLTYYSRITEGIMDVSFYHSIDQKILSTAIIKKQKQFCTVFRNKMLYK